MITFTCSACQTLMSTEIKTFALLLSTAGGGGDMLMWGGCVCLHVEARDQHGDFHTAGVGEHAGVGCMHVCT